MFGADYARGRMVTGVSLSHSRGLGTYAGVDSGQVNSAVTGLYPWIGYKASERVTVWTVAGYGAGGLMLSPGAGAPIETGLSMAMAAGGGRGQILGGGEGFGLAFKADTLWVGIRTKAASTPGGNLDSSSAAVSRLRTALEGSQSMTVAGRMALTPSVEIGIRQDGGDAETGCGIDLGAGLVLADGVTGLAVDIRVRRLLVHQAEGFAESGMSISVSYNPTPSTPLGFTARVSPAWGGEAMSGAEALWGRESMAGMSHDPLMNGGGQRLDTEVGYGLPIGSRFVGTPRAGVRTSEHGRDYRIGYGMQVLEHGRLNLQLGVDAERRESPIFHRQEQTGALPEGQRRLERLDHDHRQQRLDDEPRGHRARRELQLHAGGPRRERRGRRRAGTGADDNTPGAKSDDHRGDDQLGPERRRAHGERRHVRLRRHDHPRDHLQQGDRRDAGRPAGCGSTPTLRCRRGPVARRRPTRPPSPAPTRSRAATWP